MEIKDGQEESPFVDNAIGRINERNQIKHKRREIKDEVGPFIFDAANAGRRRVELGSKHRNVKKSPTTSKQRLHNTGKKKTRKTKEERPKGKSVVGKIMIGGAAAALIVGFICETVKHNLNCWDNSDMPDVRESIAEGIKSGMLEEAVLSDLGLTREQVEEIMELQKRINSGENEMDILKDVEKAGLNITKSKLAGAISEYMGEEVNPTDIVLYLKEDGIVKIKDPLTGTYSYDDMWISRVCGKNSISKEMRDIIITIADVQGAEEDGKTTEDDLRMWIDRLDRFAGSDIIIEEKGNIICKINPYKERHKVDYVSLPDYLTSDQGQSRIEDGYDEER